MGRLLISRSGNEARLAIGEQVPLLYNGPYSQAYQYDQWGNITYREGWGGENPSFTATYTNNKRVGLTYDAAGNLTNDGGQNFTYDSMGQAATASYSGYLLQQYYDGNGLRSKKVDGGATTYYLRSSVLGGQVVTEITGAGTFQRGYVYLGGELVALQHGGGVYWMHQDPVAKSKRVTDGSGAVVSTVELDPRGGNTNRSSNDAFQPRKFTTYERDGNGSDEAMFRRYNRWWSKFDQPDPYDGSYNLSDPQSFNRYAYVQNDPVNFVDPSGLDPQDPLPREGGIVGDVTIDISFDSSSSGIMWSGNNVFDGDLHLELRAINFPGGAQNSAPTPQDGRSSNQIACDDKIAGIFGGPGAVAATVAEPTTLLGPNKNRNAAATYDHLAGGGVFHLYTNAQGTEATVGLYKPPGSGPGSGGEYDNKGQTENYFRFSYTRGALKGVTLSFVHVGGTHGGDAGGQYLGRFPGERNRIGNIGGLGGEGVGYNHTHVKVSFKGKLTDPRKIFCKEFRF